jgi:hypothetical protein
MTKRTRKPSGAIGPFEVHYDGTRVNVQSRFVQFPQTKKEIEDLIVHGFATQACREGILPSSVRIRRNRIDDFDFTVEAPHSVRYLELMEVAPLEGIGGSHHAASGTFRPYDLARGAMDKLQQKSIRYSGVARTTGIVLLLYITHWTFTPNDTTIMLLQYWCHHESHCFEEIYFYRPHDQESGTLAVLHPTPKEHWQQWTRFDPESCWDDVVHNLMPVAVRMDEGGHPAVVMGTAVGRNTKK